MTQRIWIAALIVAGGCTAEDFGDLDATRSTAPEEIPLTLTAEQEAGVLALVNDCAIDRPTLDDDAALDARAARNVIDHRNGPDASCGTGDDDPFDDLDELDAVAYVGNAALNALLVYAQTHGYVASGGDPIVGYFDGVPFTAAEIDGVLAIANAAPCDVLDDEVGLDTRAADNIVAARPFADADAEANLAALAAVPYVGASALNALKDFIIEWFPGCPALGGEFEGVAFTDAQANDVLDLANRGTADDLDVITGIGPTLAGRIVEARPFAGVGELGAVSGIGASVLTTLRDEAASRWCTAATALCGCGAPGADPGTAITVDGIELTAAQAATALVIVNEALSAQLRADGGLAQAVTQSLLAGRPWPDLAAVGATSGIGPVVMTALRDYAASGLWQGPGDIVSAVTVAYVVQNATVLENSWVSFNQVLFTSADGGDVFDGTVKDDADASLTAKVRHYAWDPVGHSRDADPAIAAGERFQLVHVKVTLSYGELILRMVDTTEYTYRGCELDWSRACGETTGVCELGSEVCGPEGWSTCSGRVEQLGWDPPDGLDNDCDGAVDENTFSLAEIAWLDEPLEALAVDGNRSLAATDSELLGLGLSDPSDPRVLARVTPEVEAPLNVQSIRNFPGGTVLADCKNGAWIFPRPSLDLVPTLIVPSAADANVVGCTRDAYVADGVLVTANWTFGVYAHDLSGPTATEIFHAAHTYPRAVAPFGNAIATVGNQLAVYDPAAAGDTLVTASPPSYVRDMALSDDGLLVVTTSAGMAIWDIAGAPLVAVYGVWNGPDAWHADFQDHYLAVVPNGSGRTLSIIDLSMPPDPQVVAEVEVPNPNGITSGSALRGVAFVGDVIYTWGGTGLHVFELQP